MRRGLVTQFLKLQIPSLSRLHHTETVNDLPILEPPRDLKEKLRVLKIAISQHSPIKFSKNVPKWAKYRMCGGATLLYIRERAFHSRLSCDVTTQEDLGLRSIHTLSYL